MMRIIYCLLFLTLLSGVSYAQSFSEDIESVFQERTRCCVEVTGFAQFEVDRQPIHSHGIVVDNEGRIVMMEANIPAWLPPDQLKDFKVCLLGDAETEFKATYLGQDYLTSWHYIQVEEAAWGKLVPVGTFGSDSIKMGDPVWGIGVLPKAYGYQPFFLSGNVASTQKMPFDMGFGQSAVGEMGTPVFSKEGRLIGVGGQALRHERFLFMGPDTYLVGLQRAAGTTERFLQAEPFLRYYKRIPAQPLGNPQPFLGVAGLQALDVEAARFYGLQDQSAIVVSDVIAGTPADKGGLKAKDIIIKMDGQPLPKFRPNDIVRQYGEIQIAEHTPGDTLSLTVLREGQTLELQCVLAEAPKLLKEASRVYLPRLGFSIREFLVQDALNRRIVTLESQPGVIVQFVRPNSPSNSVGLQVNDWIREVNGEVVKDYAQAASLLEAVDTNPEKKDCVLLVRRGNETKVLQIKLD